MDQEEAPADILKQWQEARANRRMQFKVGNYRDGDWVSNIRMLTGTIKADWIQLPVERYLAALPTLRHGVIAGCSGTKVLPPGALLGRRSCNFRSFCLMICHWMIGMRGSTPCQRCGLRLPCWEMTICAKLLAMTFIS